MFGTHKGSCFPWSDDGIGPDFHAGSQLSPGIDKARFKQQVEPGDQLVIRVEMLRMSRGMGKFSAEARVDGKLVASAEIMGALREAHL